MEGRREGRGRVWGRVWGGGRGGRGEGVGEGMGRAGGGQALHQLSGTPVCLWPASFQKGCKSLNKQLFLHLSFPDLGIHLINNNTHTQTVDQGKLMPCLK